MLIIRRLKLVETLTQQVRHLVCMIHKPCFLAGKPNGPRLNSFTVPSCKTYPCVLIWPFKP